MTSEVEDQPKPAETQGAEATEAEIVPPKPAYTGPTPGEILRTERERQNLSQEDVVSQSRMTMETVRALEEDRDPPQNAWVYVRGYYRKYARVLGLAEEDILHAHEQVAGGAPDLGGRCGRGRDPPLRSARSRALALVQSLGAVPGSRPE